MSCGLEKDRLSGYYDGELDAGERAEIERHIASCSECLRELGDLKAAATDLKSLARVPAPPSVRAEILRQTAVRAPRFQRWFQAGVAAAAVALFAVSLVIIARQGEAEKTVATLNPPARAETPALERARVAEAKDAAGDRAALKQDKAHAAKDPASRDDKLDESKEKELFEDADMRRKPDAATPPKAEPKPAERPSPDPAPGAVPGENREELRKKAEQQPFGFAEGAEREVRRGAAPAAAVPTVLAVAAVDLPSTREETEALFKQLGVKAVVGASELGNTSHVKDHYTTVELTDAEYEALQKHLAKAKAKVASTTLAAEKAELMKLSRSREYALGASSDGGRKSGGKGAQPPAPAAPETAGADRGKSDEKKPSDGATGQGGGGAAGGRSPEGGGGKDAKETKKAQDPAADAPKGEADKQAEAKKPQAPDDKDHNEGADAEESKRAEETQQKAKLLDKAPRRRFIIHWVEPTPPAATGTDK